MAYIVSSSVSKPAEATALRNKVFGSVHLRAALNGLTAGLFTFDRSCGILFCNTALPGVLHIMPDIAHRAPSLVGLLESSTLLTLEAAQQVHEICLSVIDKSEAYRGSLHLASADAAHVLLLAVCQLEDGIWMATLEDVTSRHQAEASAIEQAMLDPLTGLPNRQLFTHRVTAMVQGTARCGDAVAGSAGPVRHAVMLVDLDRFKAVNDTLGHPIGDGLLRLVAKRLSQMLRAQDVVARLGGDEFAMLIARAPEHAALDKLARRIVDVLGRPYLVDGHLVNIGASVGIAVSSDSGLQQEQLLRSADLALYEAKQAGRSTHCFFEQEMDTRAVGRRLLEIDLRRAMALQQFELHYQPQINLDGNTVVGFEALIRWRHPERGLVPPNDFIALAEQIGLIVPLGEWVLREACREATRWPDSVSVAVNISPYQFEDAARLTGMVAQALSSSGLPGRRLEVEITESVLLRSDLEVLQALHQLRGMGVRVAMDDFGTGYSSLSQLHSFPFDKIKIDRSFVKDRGDSTAQGAIIRAITSLGVSLGMATIAEGVETSEQLDRIRAEGCNSVQGYLFSRPIPVEQIDALLARFTDTAALAAASA